MSAPCETVMRSSSLHAIANAVSASAYTRPPFVMWNPFVMSSRTIMHTTDFPASSCASTMPSAADARSRSIMARVGRTDAAPARSGSVGSVVIEGLRVELRPSLMRSWATGPKDGRPIIIDVRSGCPDMTIASSNVVLMGGGSGYSITVKEGAHLVYWGSSCAYAEEILYLMYRGYGYAAANVYSGMRIIGVCFWWTRAGVRLSPNTCSNAWEHGIVLEPRPPGRPRPVGHPGPERAAHRVQHPDDSNRPGHLRGGA